MNQVASDSFVISSLRRAGLADVLDARAKGGSLEGFAGRLAAADLLLLGALADRVRATEVGLAVRVTVTTRRPDSIDGAILVRAEEGVAADRGLAFLRAVALARINGPRAARVVVDWESCGFELAQIALSFGASELCGPVLSRRGLPIADDRVKKVKGQGMVPVATLKKQELLDIVARIGREPFMETTS